MGRWRVQALGRRLGAIALAVCFASWPWTSEAGDTRLRINVREFRFVERESGPTNYYSLVDDGNTLFIHADYKPGFKTAVYGYQIPDALRAKARALEWSWRARTLPQDHSACDAHSGIDDSPALVYVIWKRGLRWYTLRYVWSTSARQGAVCDPKRNLFLGQDTVVLQSGLGDGSWRTEHLDLAGEFRRHFENNDATASVPDLVGIGLLTDGDQSHSPSAADYTGFALAW